MTTKNTLNGKTIDETTWKAMWKAGRLEADALPAKSRAAYKAYKDAYKVAQDACDAFEKVDTEELAIHAKVDTAKYKFLFGYNFGKLAVVIVDAVQAVTTGNGSLTQWATFQTRPNVK